MHPPLGACLPDIILMYFVCANPFDIVIRVLPADTNRSVRNFVPSIPSEPTSRTFGKLFVDRLGSDSREFCVGYPVIRLVLSDTFCPI